MRARLLKKRISNPTFIRIYQDIYTLINKKVCYFTYTHHNATWLVTEHLWSVITDYPKCNNKESMDAEMMRAKYPVAFSKIPIS